MTKLEIMRANKKAYAEQVIRNTEMKGLSKRVGETMMLEWLSSNNYLGGLSGRKANKYYEMLIAEGYTEVEIDKEFNRQVDWYL